MRNIAFFSLPELDYRELIGSGVRSGIGGAITGASLASAIPEDQLENDPTLRTKTALSSAAVGLGLGLYNNYLTQQERKAAAEEQRRKRQQENRKGLAALGLGAGIGAGAYAGINLLRKGR